jgi:hypothetical protein
MLSLRGFAACSAAQNAIFEDSKKSARWEDKPAHG